MSKFLWILATLFMFSMNYFSINLPLGGQTTVELSDKLTTLITPAGFTFAIRTLIYLVVLIISFFYLFRKQVIPDSTFKRYLLSCIANGWWVIARQYGNLHLAMICMIVLLVSLIMIDSTIKHHTDLNYYHIVRSGFLLYFGWIQVATLVMVTIYLIYQLHWISADTIWWPLLCLVTGWMLSIVVLRKEKSIIPLLVFCWALFGIYKAPVSIFGIDNSHTPQINSITNNWRCERNETLFSWVILISSNQSASDWLGSKWVISWFIYEINKKDIKFDYGGGGIFKWNALLYHALKNTYNGDGYVSASHRWPRCLPYIIFKEWVFEQNNDRSDDRFTIHGETSYAK